MKIKTFNWTEELNIFEPGDKVMPLSRSSLEPGIYEVEECIEPSYPGDKVIVFVKGHKFEVIGEYLTLKI